MSADIVVGWCVGVMMLSGVIALLYNSFKYGHLRK